MNRAKSSPDAWNTGSAASTVGQLLGCPLRNENVRMAPCDPRAQLGDAVAGSGRADGDAARDVQRPHPACREEGVDQVGLEHDLDLARGNECDRALKQVERGRKIVP